MASVLEEQLLTLGRNAAILASRHVLSCAVRFITVVVQEEVIVSEFLVVGLRGSIRLLNLFSQTSTTNPEGQGTLTRRFWTGSPFSYRCF